MGRSLNFGLRASISHISRRRPIRANDPRLACINVSKSKFLAQRDLPPIELPIQRVPQEVATPREETASTHLSLEVKIDQFHLDNEGEVPENLVEVSDSETDFDRFSAAHSLRLIIARVDTSLKDKEEVMDLKQKTSLKGLLANKNKGSSSKEVPKTQVPPSLPPPPLPMTTVRLLSNPNLKRKEKYRKWRRGR